jgi:septal ring factor EnvC (AmiA/AmiB activator)
MTKPSSSVQKSDNPVVALEKTGKGSSMWELLLQLRVLLPYLSRVVPLLEPLLDRAAPKTDPAFTQNLTAIQTSSRDLEVQARNQALQLERIEQQLANLRTALETHAETNRNLAKDLEKSRARLTLFAVITLVLLLIVAGMVGFLLAHAG